MQANERDGLLYQVQQIVIPHPSNIDWHFIAQVEEKSEVKRAGYNHDPYGTIIFKGIESGDSKIKAAVFSQSLEALFNHLEVDQVYKISNAAVISRDPKFRDRLNNPAQLILKLGTRIVRIMDPTSHPPSQKKSRIDEPAASCSSLKEPSALEVNIYGPSRSVSSSTDLKSLKLNQTTRTVAVIKEVMHNGTWGYAKCKINPHCDQEMHFDENETLWECLKCEEKTNSEFEWDPQLKIKICDGTASIVASCDSQIAGKILGESVKEIGTLSTQKEIGKLDQLAMKATFQHFFFELSSRGKATGEPIVRVEQLITPTPEQTAILFSKFIMETIDKKFTFKDQLLPGGIVKLENARDNIEKQDRTP